GTVSAGLEIPARTHLYTVDGLLTGNVAVFADVVWHLVLPAITLSTITMAIVSRMARSSMLEVLGSEYLVTARANALRDRAAGLRATAVGSRIAKDANSPQSQWAAARRRFVHSGTGMLGAALLVLFLLVAVFAAQVSPYDPIHQDFRIERETPSAEHLMGTDEFGRDVFSRVVWGARVSLQAGAIAASIALVVGLALGM